MALSNDELHRASADHAENQAADPAAFAEHPGITIADAYDSRAWVEMVRSHAQSKAHKIGDLEGDAERALSTSRIILPTTCSLMMAPGAD